jgi:hypothetical protein
MADGTDVQFARVADFVSRYANNVRLEAYGTDLKLIFGQSEQSSGREVIEQHTAITISWAEVRILIYYLSVQLAVYESQIGAPVTVHPVLRPSPIADPPDEILKADPRAGHTAEILRRIREELLASIR